MPQSFTQADRVLFPEFCKTQRPEEQTQETAQSLPELTREAKRKGPRAFAASRIKSHFANKY